MLQSLVLKIMVHISIEFVDILLRSLFLSKKKKNLSNHARGDNFKPYNDFFNLQTFPLLIFPSKLGGKSINTSSSKFPWKNAFFLHQIVVEILMEFIFSMSAKGF